MLNSKSPAQFTDSQRSQQARGKSYASKAAGEPYEARAKREQAAQILESVELLSVAQTRQHFQNVMLGLPDPKPVYSKGKELQR
ncbi:hypothetical protein PMIN06_011083 [Paraphaeosphaeria minitans]